MKKYKNVFNFIDISLSKINIPEDKICGCTVVFQSKGLESVYVRNRKLTENQIYYIGKINKILSTVDFEQYVENHPEENFIILKDNSYYGYSHKSWGYLDSKDNNICLRGYDVDKDYSIKLTFELHNIESKPIWAPAKLYNKNIISNIKLDLLNQSKRSYSYSLQLIGYNDMYGNVSFNGTINTLYLDCIWLYDSAMKGFRDTRLQSIMNKNIKLPGENRILALYDGGGVAYHVSVGEHSIGDVINKYGVSDSTYSDGYSYSAPLYDKADKYPDDKLDEETHNKVVNYIKECLQNGVCGRAPGYRLEGEEPEIYSKDYVIITDPAPKHQCPTFHYYIGLKSESCDVIDVVELARGELYVKDMIPKTCYVLNADGNYYRVRNKFYSGIKEFVVKAEMDPQSLADWSEEKSLHPELLAAVTKSGAISRIGLKAVKTFNTLPFGALFIEQLVKDNKLILAKQLGDLIHSTADRLEYTCNNLNDIFPGANPMGGSILKTLNLTKPCYDLLVELVGDFNDDEYDYKYNRETNSHIYIGKTIKRTIKMYKLIKANIPDGVVTSENRKLLNQYIYLEDNRWTKFNDYRTGMEVDLLQYPRLIKPIYKMVNRLNAGFEGTKHEWEAKRHYDEILNAYIKFLTLNWNPEDYKIFIEFGLSGTQDEMLQELSEREEAANKALKIYQDKIDEVAHKRNEQQYKVRKEVLEKLVSKQIIVKDEEGIKHLYTVMVPTQIYGEDVVGSIEKEGKDMNHCLFRQYADKISNGTYTVVYLRNKTEPTKSLVTIGITNDGRINQTYAVNDSMISKVQAKAIIEWAKSKEGLVTFKSEKAVVRPGGWNYSVEVPKLKDVDEKWIRNIAKIA